MNFQLKLADKIPIRKKQFWLPGAALLLSILLLIGCSLSFDYLFSHMPVFGVIVDELIAFGIPAALLYAFRDKTFPLNLRVERRHGYVYQYFGFTLKFALTISFLSFLANLIVYVISGSSKITLTGSVYASLLGSRFGLLSFIAIVIVPPIVEEFFLRGVLFSAMENGAGTKLCILMSGICFAFLHSNPNNLVGPFLAGCAYAFLCYCFDSIYPAIIAHMINNCYYFVVNYLVTAYSSFGIWHYFTFINFILFLLSLYLMLRSLTVQIQLNRLRPLRPEPVSVRNSLRRVVLTPGIAAFTVVFLLSVFLI